MVSRAPHLYRQIKPGSIQTDLLQFFPSMMTHKESFKIMLWMNKVYVKKVEENMRAQINNDLSAMEVK